MSSAATIPLSVVIPVFNEEGNLPTLFSRLYPVLDALGRSYEIIKSSAQYPCRCT